MDWRSLAMGISFSIMWSSAFTSARIALAYAPPLLILSFRFLISGLLAIVIAWLLGQRIRLSKKEWIGVIVLGLCQNSIYLGSSFIAMQWVEASVVVIVASVLPLLVAPAQWLFLGERTALLGVFGLCGGFAGAAFIMANRLAGGTDPYGLLFAFGGVLALTAATLLVGGAFSRSRNILMIVGLQMLVGSITLFPVSLALETWTVNWSTSFVLAFSWTTLIAGLLATYVWFLLLGRIGPTKAATYHFLNPFFGVMIAAIVLSEPMSHLDLIGVLVIMLGILMVQLSRRA